MKYFIIIDHSIIDNGGHHYEYALRVLEAAEKAGYRPLLAVNRKFKPHLDVPWQVFPLYRYGFWIQTQDSRIYLLFKSLSNSFRNSWTRIKGSLAFSRAGFFWVRRNRPADILRSSQYITPFNIILFTGLFILQTMLHLIYSLRILIPFRGYFLGILTALKKGMLTLFKYLKNLFHPPRWLLEKAANYRKIRSFARDTERLLYKVGVHQGDIVFIPTLAEPEMLGLLKMFERVKASKTVSWHLLFRRNIYEGREPDYLAQEEGLRPLRNTFRYFDRFSPAHQIYFYTDTQQLSDQYNRFGISRTFHTLPVPVSHDYYGSLPRGEYPLKVIYVGDARTEKGYHHLPRIMQDLPPVYYEQNRVAFELQSVFNTSQGEPAAIIARSQLANEDCAKVRLIMSSLSTDEYRDFVLQGDILLILYTSERYYARSSGIFIEALMAGRPVIVPAGTWMALQLTASIYEYHTRILDNAKILDKRNIHSIFWNQPGRLAVHPDEETGFRVSGSDGMRMTMVVPPGATHLLVTFEQGDEAAGHFVRFLLEQYDQTEFALNKKTEISGGSCQPASVLFSLHEQVLKVNLYMAPAYSSETVDLDTMDIKFLSVSDDIPMNTIGMIYSDEADISDCVRELVDHFDHYRKTSYENSSLVAMSYTPDALVRRMEETISMSDATESKMNITGNRLA